jgi:hypothetical protein
MKKLLLVAATIVSTGCSTLMYPRGYQPGGYYPSAYRGRGTVAPEYVPVGRWDNVMRLARQTVIDVLTRDGRATVGGFVDADEQYVRVLLGDLEVSISRLDIVRIDLVDLPGSTTRAVARRAAGGAILGAAGAVLLAGVIGGEAWPPPGALVRAGVAGGALVGGETELSQRRSRLIYLAPSYGRP